MTIPLTTEKATPKSISSFLEQDVIVQLWLGMILQVELLVVILWPV